MLKVEYKEQTKRQPSTLHSWLPHHAALTSDTWMAMWISGQQTPGQLESTCPPASRGIGGGTATQEEVAANAGNWGQKAGLEFQGKSSWIEPVTVGQPDTFIRRGYCPSG